ncbi:MAG: Gfo/Idh/MocA family oxidoreductase, partial [Nitrospirae bacterium]|nr:Gfo/Idh/MocA family oxidoreductase [Nitrospirota bacterium]
EIARAALLNGKHVFVEKPFTSTVAEAIDLIEIADKKGLKIMVDHTLLFTGSVRKIKELIDNKELGNIYYYDSTRINLGLFQHDVNVIWDLAPHDLSIMDYIIEDRPIAITANGVDHFKRGLEDVAYITIYFENNIIAHFNMNWLSPVKMRTTVIGGDKKMLIWNDLAADEKIKIYDRGVNIESKEGVYKLLVDYRSGDIWTPKIDMTEALKLEAEYMIDCIYNNITPINDGNAGLSVVRILEASLLSIKNNGKMVNL